MPTIQSEDLTKFGQALFEAIGVPSEVAGRVMRSLVASNLIGHDSHGVQLISGYVARVQEGRIVPTAQPKVERQTGAIAVVDGGWGFGQVNAPFAAQVAVRLAREHGLGCVALTRTNHIARLGEYAQMLAEAGLVGMLITGVHTPEGIVAPFGGRDRIFGTNPMAWALPVDHSRPPLVLDFATSGVAYGKVSLAHSKGQSVAEGLLLDQDGHPSTDPASLMDGGLLLPFGGHKGSGLLLMVELLTTGLVGFADQTADGTKHGNPTLMVAWSIEAFQPAEQFEAYVETLLARIKSSRPAAGFDEVLLPGEPEAHVKAVREQEGIPIPDMTWEELTKLAEALGVPC